MSRWENMDLSGLDLPDLPEREEVFIGADGETSEPDSSFAKMVSTTTGDKTENRFYIRFGRGNIVNPNLMDKRINDKLYRFRKVSKKTFDLYRKYLLTKNVLFFTFARRALLDE